MAEKCLGWDGARNLFVFTSSKTIDGLCKPESLLEGWPAVSEFRRHELAIARDEKGDPGEMGVGGTRPEAAEPDLMYNRYSQDLSKGLMRMTDGP